MYETHVNGDANLAWQAFLYASGELDEKRAVAFEDRLGNDQAAREALSLAAQLAVLPGVTPPLGPNPDYRDAVRLRLRQGDGGWSRLLGRRAYRGHPLLWGLVGAAAAVLIVVGLGQAGVHLPFGPAATTTVVQVPVPQVDEDEGAVDPSLEAASVWAEISQSDHLLKAHGDELRRKTRSEEWRRLVDPNTRGTHVSPKPCYEEMR